MTTTTTTKTGAKARDGRVDEGARDNFLANLDGLSYQEARANLEIDARSYSWNHETVAAIACGLIDFFYSDLAGGQRT